MVKLSIGGVLVYYYRFIFKGAIIFEMLTGLPPFYHKEREKLFNNIKTANIKFPSYLSKETISLLSVYLLFNKL